MRAGFALAFLLAVFLAGCGSDSGGETVAAIDQGSTDSAYQEAYTAAWVKSCKAAVSDIRKDAPGKASQVNCAQPVEQMEGNTSFDPEQAKVEGRRQGTFDGCAYAWDEAYASGGEIEPRC